MTPFNSRFAIIIIIIIIYLVQAARPISQHNIHIEGKKRKEQKKTLKTTRPKTYYAMHIAL